MEWGGAGWRLRQMRRILLGSIVRWNGVGRGRVALASNETYSPRIDRALEWSGEGPGGAHVQKRDAYPCCSFTALLIHCAAHSLRCSFTALLTYCAAHLLRCSLTALLTYCAAHLLRSFYRSSSTFS